MTDEHEREIAARVKEAENIEDGIRAEVRRDIYGRKDIVAAWSIRGRSRRFRGPSAGGCTTRAKTTPRSPGISG